jgi:hypothetical protein
LVSKTRMAALQTEQSVPQDTKARMTAKALAAAGQSQSAKIEGPERAKSADSWWSWFWR